MPGHNDNSTDCSAGQKQAWSAAQQLLRTHLVGSTAGRALGLLGGTGGRAHGLVSGALGLARHVVSCALGLACQLLGAGQLAQVGGGVLCLQRATGSVPLHWECLPEHRVP